MRSVALDLGKRITFCEVRDQKVIGRRVVSDFGELDDLLGPARPKARVAIEACLEAWHIHDLLKRAGHEPLFVDTTRVRQLGIGHHKRKTDKIDAEILAKAVELDRIPRAHVLSPAARELRQLHGVRRSLVKARAELATQAKAIGRAHGIKMPKAKPVKLAAAVAKMLAPDDVLELLCPLVEMISELSDRIAAVDAKLKAAAEKLPVVRRLATAPGVATVVATAFVSVIDDPNRFDCAHKVSAYVGLVPSEYSSSDKRQLGHITKQGNTYLRALLVQGAWSVLRAPSSDPLKVWGEQLRARRGSKVAVVAIARKLAGVLWAMWRDERDYNPIKLGGQTAAGIAHAAKMTDSTSKRVGRAALVAAAGR